MNLMGMMSKITFSSAWGPRIRTAIDALKLDLPWIERLDMVNDLAPLAPELAVQLEKHEQKRANQFKGNAKIPYIKPEDDPILNDFKREMLFHRQAQAAVREGIKRLHDLGITTKRPDDYFAEMAKTDDHMQKKKMGKMLAKQTRVQREMDKKDMLDQLKKFRKGKLKNLDFLEDSKAAAGQKKKTDAKRKARDKKFGFGGKKKGLKRNTRESSGNIEKSGKNFRKPGKAGPPPQYF
uniref:Uncharacterized protein n=1 Tax=Megaselia scalaris TaxID=36166 RepID=T1GHT4_MEGSC